MANLPARSAGPSFFWQAESPTIRTLIANPAQMLLPILVMRSPRSDGYTAHDQSPTIVMCLVRPSYPLIWINQWVLNRIYTRSVSVHWRRVVGSAPLTIRGCAKDLKKQI